MKPIFTSMVDLSDHGDQMTKLHARPCPTMFISGEQNARLPYLGHLAANDVMTCEVPD